MPEETSQFRFTVTDKTFKVVSTIAAAVVIGYKTWNWTIDNAVAKRDWQNEHRQFKEMLLGTDKEPGMVNLMKESRTALVRLDADYGKLWLDMEALKKWRDAMTLPATHAPATPTPK